MNYINKETEYKLVTNANKAIEKTDVNYFKLKYCHCSSGEDRWSYPLFRVANREAMNKVATALLNAGIACNTDVYIDEDGDDSRGRPMLRYVYSVEMRDVICEPRLTLYTN